MSVTPFASHSRASGDTRSSARRRHHPAQCHQTDVVTGANGGAVRRDLDQVVSRRRRHGRKDRRRRSYLIDERPLLGHTHGQERCLGCCFPMKSAYGDSGRSSVPLRRMAQAGHFVHKNLTIPSDRDKAARSAGRRPVCKGFPVCLINENSHLPRHSSPLPWRKNSPRLDCPD